MRRKIFCQQLCEERGLCTSKAMAGYLTTANREEIGANVPRELKDRFARIVGSTPPCPKPPWWAVWK